MRETVRGLSWIPQIYPQRSSAETGDGSSLAGESCEMDGVLEQKLQKALDFSLTALDCVTSTNYLGLKGFGGFLFCFLFIK